MLLYSRESADHVFKMCGVKKRLLDFRSIARSISWRPACRSSWGGGQLGCWARHLLERWLLQTRACSILRRFGRRVEDVLGRFLPSCCLGQRYQPTPRFQRTSTRGRQPSRLELLNRFGQRSVPCEGNGEHVQRGTEVLLGKIWSWPWPWLFLLYHVQTWCRFVEIGERIKYRLASWVKIAFWTSSDGRKQFCYRKRIQTQKRIETHFFRPITALGAKVREQWNAQWRTIECADVCMFTKSEFRSVFVFRSVFLP